MTTISIDVNLRDILDELDTEDLKRELRERGEDASTLSDTQRDYVEQAHHALLRHNPAEALLYVETALFGRQRIAGKKLVSVQRRAD